STLRHGTSGTSRVKQFADGYHTPCRRSERLGPRGPSARAQHAILRGLCPPRARARSARRLRRGFYLKQSIRRPNGVLTTPLVEVLVHSPKLGLDLSHLRSGPPRAEAPSRSVTFCLAARITTTQPGAPAIDEDVHRYAHPLRLVWPHAAGHCEPTRAGMSPYE